MLLLLGFLSRAFAKLVGGLVEFSSVIDVLSKLLTCIWALYLPIGLGIAPSSHGLPVLW